VRKRIQLLVGSREEIHWEDFERFHTEGHALPDYSFTPDGEFPVTNREKGNCELRLVFPREGPDAAALTFISGAAAVNSVPGRAVAEVQNLPPPTQSPNLRVEALPNGATRLTAMGREAHASMPESGDNALLRLFEALAALRPESYPKAWQFIRDTLARSYYADEALDFPAMTDSMNGEELGRTTVAPSQCWLDEAGLNLMLSIRARYGVTRGQVAKIFDDLAMRYGLTYKITDWLDPLYVPGDSAFVQLLCAAWEAVSGTPGTPELQAGTTYAKAIPGCVAFGPCMPWVENSSHMPDEHIALSDLKTALRVYITVLSEVAFSDTSFR
jgi:succinyl-diaminopimelate desuccinylase